MLMYQEGPNRTLLEGFPISLLNQVYNFYQELQKVGIDQSKEKGSKKQSNSPKTKTQYAYDYKK